MILWCIGGADATEEAQDDGIERSVPGAAGPDHQHEARAGSARRQDRLGLDRRRGRAALQREWPARDETRFMIGLLLLKHTYGLSDEGVCERWVHDPYFQFFTGQEFFQHAFPHERSDLSHWRKRLGDKLELLLAESLRVAHEAGALRGQDLKRVTVDT